MPELVRALEPEVGRLTTETLDGFLAPIELPIREVVLELMRVLGPGSARLVVLKLAPVRLLLLRERLDDV